MDTTHSSLLIRCQDRDPVALGKLASIYQPFITNQLKGIVFDTHLCDDVAQEAMIFALGRVAEFRRQRKGSFRKWLRRIVSNTALRILKSRQRERDRTDPLESAVAMEAMEKLAIEDSALARRWELEHAEYLVNQLEAEFKLRSAENADRNWSIFQAMTVREPANLDVEAIARLYGLSVSQCYRIRGDVAAILQEIRIDWREFFNSEDL